MKMYRTILTLLISATIFTACQSDDNGNVEELLPIDVRNRVDDEAIALILNDYYLNDQGKITAFSETDASDDDRTPLKELATYDDRGFWVVKRADYQSSGRKVTDIEKDKILIQYDMLTFIGRTNKKQDSTYYSSLSRFSSTINTTGFPLWNPNFFYKELSEIEIENKVERSWYEMEGIQEGIKAFHSADKEDSATPYVDFQGLIIVPSRLVFGRERNAIGMGTDQSVILNFELYKVEDKD